MYLRFPLFAAFCIFVFPLVVIRVDTASTLQTPVLKAVLADGGSSEFGFVSDAPGGSPSDTYFAARNKSGDTSHCCIWRVEGGIARPVLDEAGKHLSGVNANVWCNSGGSLCVIHSDDGKKLVRLSGLKATTILFNEGETPGKLAGYLYGAKAQIYCPQDSTAVFRIKENKATRIALRAEGTEEFWASNLVESEGGCLICGCKLGTYKCAGIWRLTSDDKLERVQVSGGGIVGASLPELVATQQNVYLNGLGTAGETNFWVYTGKEFKEFSLPKGFELDLRRAWVLGSSKSVVYVRTRNGEYANGVVAIEDGKPPQLVRLANGKAVGGVNARPLNWGEGLLVECSGVEEEDPEQEARANRYYCCRGACAEEVVFPVGTKLAIVTGAIAGNGALLLDKNVDTGKATLFVVDGMGKAGIATLPSGKPFVIPCGGSFGSSPSQEAGHANVGSSQGIAYCAYYNNEDAAKENGLLVLAK
jgi:hypothetical protein